MVSIVCVWVGGWVGGWEDRYLLQKILLLHFQHQQQYGILPRAFLELRNWQIWPSGLTNFNLHIRFSTVKTLDDSTFISCSFTNCLHEIRCIDAHVIDLLYCCRTFPPWICRTICAIQISVEFCSTPQNFFNVSFAKPTSISKKFESIPVERQMTCYKKLTVFEIFVSTYYMD